MAHQLSRAALAATLAAIVTLAFSSSAHADGYGQSGWTSPEPNYYAMPTGAGPTAAMYPCPRPAPPLVGQTYITYGPLAPQEFMYLHHDTYLTCHGQGQWTTTSVTYGHRFSLHPSLRTMSPGVHTPAMVNCGL